MLHEGELLKYEIDPQFYFYEDILRFKFKRKNKERIYVTGKMWRNSYFILVWDKLLMYWSKQFSCIMIDKRQPIDTRQNITGLKNTSRENILESPFFL